MGILHRIPKRSNSELKHDEQSHGSHLDRHDAYDGFYVDMSGALPRLSRSTQSIDEEEDVDEIAPNDIVIAVMGVTGAGKSTFVSHFCSDAKIGTGLKSCTEQVQPFLCTNLDLTPGRRLYMVDTPGFDDSGSGRSDTDILGEIAAFLSDTYQNNILLTGIIYLHRISDNRVGGSGLRQMKMFRKLCGEQSMANVVVATTMWSLARPNEAEQREHELMTEEGFFKQMMRNGTKMVRQDRGKESAYDIVRSLIGTSRPGAFDIQEEMVDRHKRLDETAAGQVVEAELSKLRKKHETELEELREEMEEALEQKDYALAEEIGSIKADIEQRLQQEQEASKRLQQSHNDLIRRMQEQHSTDQRYLQNTLDSQRREQNQMAQDLRRAAQTSSQLEQERQRREQLETQVANLQTQVDQAQNSFAHRNYCRCWQCNPIQPQWYYYR